MEELFKCTSTSVIMRGMGYFLVAAVENLFHLTTLKRWLFRSGRVDFIAMGIRKNTPPFRKSLM